MCALFTIYHNNTRIAEYYSKLNAPPTFRRLKSVLIYEIFFFHFVFIVCFIRVNLLIWGMIRLSELVIYSISYRQVKITLLSSECVQLKIRFCLMLTMIMSYVRAFTWKFQCITEISGYLLKSFRIFEQTNFSFCLLFELDAISNARWA